MVKVTETGMASGCCFSYRFGNLKSHELTLIYYTEINCKINSKEPSVQTSFMNIIQLFKY